MMPLVLSLVSVVGLAGILGAFLLLSYRNIQEESRVRIPIEKENYHDHIKN
ncbi:MAG TPA: hypothetical protein VK118_06840 [Tetragenococcus sp.]|nr:hypothetical protein [Tetragenococcus sp.]